MIKRSELIELIREKVLEAGSEDTSIFRASEEVLKLIEKYMEPKLRSLTSNEIEDHPLVKLIHESRRDEVRHYVANLDYEKKREFLPE